MDRKFYTIFFFPPFHLFLLQSMATSERTMHGIGRFYEITIFHSNLMLFAYMVRVTSADMIKKKLRIHCGNTNFCRNFGEFRELSKTDFTPL